MSISSSICVGRSFLDSPDSPRGPSNFLSRLAGLRDCDIDLTYPGCKFHCNHGTLCCSRRNVDHTLNHWSNRRGRVRSTMSDRRIQLALELPFSLPVGRHGRGANTTITRLSLGAQSPLGVRKDHWHACHLQRTSPFDGGDAGREVPPRRISR